MKKKLISLSLFIILTSTVFLATSGEQYNNIHIIEDKNLVGDLIWPDYPDKKPIIYS